MLNPYNSSRGLNPYKIVFRVANSIPKHIHSRNIQTDIYEPFKVVGDQNSSNINDINQPEEDKLKFLASQPELFRNFSNISLNLGAEMILNRLIFLKMKKSNSTTQENLTEKEELKQMYENNRQGESFDNYSALNYLPNRWIGKRIPYCISNNIKAIKGLNSILVSTIKDFCKDSGIKFEKGVRVLGC